MTSAQIAMDRLLWKKYQISSVCFLSGSKIELDPDYKKNEHDIEQLLIRHNISAPIKIY